MPSFDVISKVNYQEFDNALANCLREISNRYDFKGLNISIERKDKTITTIATDELKLKQVKVLIYEPIANDKKISNLIYSLDEFKSKSDIIIANRYSNELDDVKQKVLTRDFFDVS